MCVQVSRAENGVIIRVTGSLDQEAAVLLRRALFDLIVDQANAQLVLDLCEVTEMSEAALQAVDEAKRWTNQSNSHLGVLPQNRRTFGSQPKRASRSPPA